MTKKFHAKLTELLQTDARLVDEDGDLIGAVVTDYASKTDHGLVRLLLGDSDIKKLFFAEIDGHWVFDAHRFIEYVSDKQFFANSYTRFRNRIGLNIDGKYLRERGEVSLVWPYKDCVLEGGQTKEEEKRKEIFFNEILAQDEIDRLFDRKVLTNWKRCTSGNEQPVAKIQRDENGTIRENLIVKGNNLLALHTLQTQFRGKVKLIYIDPPYNPPSNSNTFCYNNHFNRSSWLTFMKNRLEMGKLLLTTDGAMIIAIDENQQAYLGVLIDEIFPEYEKHCVTIVHNPRGITGTNFSYTHEYAYFVIPKGMKTIGNREIDTLEVTWRGLRDNGGESLRTDAKNCFYPIVADKRTNKIVDFGDVCAHEVHPEANIHKGNLVEIYPVDKNQVERKWRYARQSVEKVRGLLKVTVSGGLYGVQIGKDFGTYRTVWAEKRHDSNEHGTKLINRLVPNNKFNFPKSLWNVYDCIRAVVGDDKNAIILDYHAGSGTTAHAVLLLNKDGGSRKFILVEQMDYIDDVTCARVKQVMQNENIDDSFVYCALMQYNESYMGKIQRSKTSAQLVTLWQRIAEKSFLNWYANPKMPEEAVADFVAIGKRKNGLNEQKKLLAELLNKNQLYVNLSEIDDKDFTVGSGTKKLNLEFYEDM